MLNSEGEDQSQEKCVGNGTKKCDPNEKQQENEYTEKDKGPVFRGAIGLVDKTATHADADKPQRTMKEKSKEEQLAQDEGERPEGKIKRSSEAAERRGDMRKEQIQARSNSQNAGV